MDSLTPTEIHHLSVLKTAREMGLWPSPVPQSFAERHGITLETGIEAQTAVDRLVYRCTLRRTDSAASMSVRFQVTMGYPDPPSADEVLRWLAMGSAHLQHTGDLSHWESLHVLAANTTSERYAYRGLVRSPVGNPGFYEALLMETRRFYAFLGQRAFDALLVTVDAME